ncbi:biotin--[acetyl-CoA-carboxylase] ligase [Isobaculum melis]|uniref:Bifunctional ligase/repressor BirA n=1 Tax=Isobaculum melis TaxID=142588 RepID=A0A1H9RXR2_9LACT|nr:biotin--[acetyl-CoA-carboxylase] ligase [Isobaculum melis]SER76903.1 BirA family transcriptional regulator, biotin operon repressor / biotin-[acetyl-CoA-carboxylase] ligase [Isobaculum melis]
MKTTKQKILHLLIKEAPNALSGEKMGQLLAISRTAIWKGIQSLKDDGYGIVSQGKNGYALPYLPIDEAKIRQQLKTHFLGQKMQVFPTIPSTNVFAKEEAQQKPENGKVYLAEEQTLGRGRLGRVWSSPKGKTIALSMVLTPEIPPMEASKLTQIVAAAFVEATKNIADVQIKWPNDIVINGKKLCGILTEISAELTQIHYVVIGIGINTNLSFEEMPPDIQEKATSLLQVLGKEIDPNHLIASFLTTFEKYYAAFIATGNYQPTLQICRQHSAVIGKEIYVIQQDSKRLAKAVDIDEKGQLLVQFENEKKTTPIFAGEVSIRGTQGYI